MTTTISSLTNNIKIISHSMQNFSSVSLGIWIEVGSRNEKEDEQGISHLLEHMAFKGTKGRTSKQIALEIENVGGDINASTSVERTSYYVRLLKNDLEIGVSILSDIIQNSVFDPNELKKEKSVILQELAATLDSPDDMVFENFQSAAYHDQAIGRSILGNKETLLNIDSEKLISYLNKFYHSDNIIIVATGAVDHGNLHNLCEKHLSKLESTKSPKANIASYKPNEIREIRDIEQAHIIYAFEGCSYHDSQLYVSHVFSNILGGGMSSRLFQNIRENLGLAYSVFSFSSSYKDTGVFGIYSATSPDKVKEYSISVAQEIKNSALNITDEEIQKAKKQIRAGLLISSENPVARMNQIARQMSIYDKLLDMNEMLEKIDNINKKDINEFIGNTFKPEKMTISALGAISELDEITKIRSFYE
ncbi:MAG: pitrilysin family protein [Hyphomicrobiales bacterium]|nr:pitrilysin family protein [Hyphomicrobiales bacterium]|tara:strand:- start:310 stop:1569 length:1260 start_codon:yes stop_codon:yes gene_type:complete